MRKAAAILCCIFAGLLMAGCGSIPEDNNWPACRYPNFNITGPTDKLISDPYFWARLQFTQGDVLVEGANPNDYPICYANGDIGSAPGDELFVRDDVFGMKYHRVFVFSRENGAYRFLGWFDAGTVTITEKGAIVAGPPVGSKDTICQYRYESAAGQPGKLTSFSTFAQPLLVGTGAPDKNNEICANLIKGGKILQWQEY